MTPERVQSWERAALAWHERAGEARGRGHHLHADTLRDRSDHCLDVLASVYRARTRVRRISSTWAA